MGTCVSCLRHAIEEHSEKNECVVTFALAITVISELSVKQIDSVPVKCETFWVQYVRLLRHREPRFCTTHHEILPGWWLLSHL